MNALGFISFPTLSFLSIASFKILLLFLNSLHGFCISCFNTLLLVFWFPTVGLTGCWKSKCFFFLLQKDRGWGNLFWLHLCARTFYDTDGGWFYGWQWACQMISGQTWNAEHISTLPISNSFCSHSQVELILSRRKIYILYKALEYW